MKATIPIVPHIMPPAAFDTWDDVIELVERSPRPDAHAAAALRRARALRKRGLMIRFLLMVVLPTVLAGGYFGLIASDRYLSEARFVVRQTSALGPAASQSLSPEAGTKALGGSDDSYLVRDYMLSRDAMHLLIDKADLRHALARGHGDPLWQYPGPMSRDTDEGLFRAYPSFVDVDFAASTGLTTLQVQAFDPEDARRIASTLIEGAEALLNQLHDRARADALRAAENEVTRARALAVVAQDHLTAFRTRESVIDPGLLAQTGIATIATLALQAADTAAQIDVTMHASPNSPQIGPLRARVRALQAQIDHERAAMAGSDASFAPKIAVYEQLVLELDFASHSYVSALGMREMARLDASRQQNYIERVVDARAADKARYPRRVLWTVAVLVGGLLTFWLFRPSAPAAPPEHRWS